MERLMFLVDDVSDTCLLSIVIIELMKKLFFVSLINYIAKVGLEWIVRTEYQVRQCHFELVLFHCKHTLDLV